MIRMRMRGDDGMKGFGEELLRSMKPAATAAVRDSLLILEGTAKQMLSHPGTGRIYERGERQVSFASRSTAVGGSVFSRKGRNVRGVSFTANRGKASSTHQASAPGQPPAVDAAGLRASITHAPPVWSGWSVTGEWGTNVEYADDLEYGTFRMAPRPWMRPTVEEARPAVIARLERM